MYSLFFDCSKKNLESATGFIIKNDKNVIISTGYVSLPISNLTNNSLEYMALLMGLHQAKLLNIKILFVFGDSKAVIDHCTRSCKQKSKFAKQFQKTLEELEQNFDKIEYKWIPRKENKEVDRICR